jgi:hypothetical protein
VLANTSEPGSPQLQQHLIDSETPTPSAKISEVLPTGVVQSLPLKDEEAYHPPIQPERHLPRPTQPRSETSGTHSTTWKSAVRQISDLAGSLGDLFKRETEEDEKQIGQLSARLEKSESAKKELQHTLEAAQVEVSGLKTKLTALNLSLEDVDNKRTTAEYRVQSLETELKTLLVRVEAAESKASATLVQLEASREEAVRERDIVRREARRVMGEQIGSSLAEELKMVREIEKSPLSAEGEKFLRRVVNEMISRLETQGVPIRR